MTQTGSAATDAAPSLGLRRDSTNVAGQSTKRIAFLSFDWDFEIITEYYYGLEEAARATEGVQVFIFSAFGHHHENFEPDPGSHKVFELCNLEKYDAFLIQGNRTWPPDRRQAYVDTAVRLGKPVISINYDLEGAHTVGTDNYAAMRGLIERVLDDSGRTRPAFVNGLATSVEAQARARAFRDVCEERELAGARFYQANWQTEEGRATAERMLAEPDDLPDIIFCCNDDLAFGVQETLTARGVAIPQDVMVTGFDNREISQHIIPRITTVDRDYRTIAKTAFDALIALMDGEEVPHEVFSPCRYILAPSCGYAVDAVFAPDEHYSLDNSLKHFYEVASNFQSAISNGGSLAGILDVCERFAPHVECPNVYLSINDHFLHPNNEHSIDTYSTVSHLMAYAGTAINKSSDERHVYASYLTETLLPATVPSDAPVYAVYPLRQGAICIGLLVTEGISPIASHGFLAFCLTLLSVSLEAARKTDMLKAANSRLDDLYVHDELTGLFNRFGLDRFGRLAYQHLLRDFEEAYFIFVDVDDMKEINDACGHEMGDCALRDTADIIRRAAFGENAFSMRYGGDEFLIICRRDLTLRLEAGLQMMAAREHQPYRLELSIGAHHVSVADAYSLDEAISRADAMMYIQKKEHKRHKGAASGNAGEGAVAGDPSAPVAHAPEGA